MSTTATQDEQNQTQLQDDHDSSSTQNPPDQQSQTLSSTNSTNIDMKSSSSNQPQQPVMQQNTSASDQPIIENITTMPSQESSIPTAPHDQQSSQNLLTSTKKEDDQATGDDKADKPITEKPVETVKKDEASASTIKSDVGNVDKSSSEKAIGQPTSSVKHDTHEVELKETTNEPVKSESDQTIVEQKVDQLVSHVTESIEQQKTDEVSPQPVKDEKKNVNEPTTSSAELADIKDSSKDEIAQTSATPLRDEQEHTIFSTEKATTESVQPPPKPQTSVIDKQNDASTEKAVEQTSSMAAASTSAKAQADQPEQASQTSSPDKKDDQVVEKVIDQLPPSMTKDTIEKVIDKKPEDKPVKSIEQPASSPEKSIAETAKGEQASQSSVKTDKEKKDDPKSGNLAAQAALVTAQDISKNVQSKETSATTVESTQQATSSIEKNTTVDVVQEENTEQSAKLEIVETEEETTEKAAKPASSTAIEGTVETVKDVESKEMSVKPAAVAALSTEKNTAEKETGEPVTEMSTVSKTDGQDNTISKETGEQVATVPSQDISVADERRQAVQNSPESVKTEKDDAIVKKADEQAPVASAPSSSENVGEKQMQQTPAESANLEKEVPIKEAIKQEPVAAASSAYENLEEKQAPTKIVEPEKNVKDDVTTETTDGQTAAVASHDISETVEKDSEPTNLSPEKDEKDEPDTEKAAKQAESSVSQDISEPVQKTETENTSDKSVEQTAKPTEKGSENIGTEQAPRASVEDNNDSAITKKVAEKPSSSVAQDISGTVQEVTVQTVVELEKGVALTEKAVEKEPLPIATDTSRNDEGKQVPQTTVDSVQDGKVKLSGQGTVEKVTSGAVEDISKPVENPEPSSTSVQPAKQAASSTTKNDSETAGMGETLVAITKQVASSSDKKTSENIEVKQPPQTIVEPKLGEKHDVVARKSVEEAPPSVTQDGSKPVDNTQRKDMKDKSPEQAKLSVEEVSSGNDDVKQSSQLTVEPEQCDIVDVKIEKTAESAASSSRAEVSELVEHTEITDLKLERTEQAAPSTAQNNSKTAQDDDTSGKATEQVPSSTCKDSPENFEAEQSLQTPIKLGQSEKHDMAPDKSVEKATSSVTQDISEPAENIALKDMEVKSTEQAGSSVKEGSSRNAGVRTSPYSNIEPEQGETKDLGIERTAEPTDKSIAENISEPAADVELKNVVEKQGTPANVQEEQSSKTTIESQKVEKDHLSTEKTAEPSATSVEDAKAMEKADKSLEHVASSTAQDSSVNVKVEKAPPTVESVKDEIDDTTVKVAIEQATSSVKQDIFEPVENIKVEEKEVKPTEQTASSVGEVSTNVQVKQSSPKTVESQKDETDDATIEKIPKPSASSVTKEISEPVTDVEMKHVSDIPTENVVSSTGKDSSSNVKDEIATPTTVEDAKDDVTAKIAVEKASSSVAQDISEPVQNTEIEGTMVKSAEQTTSSAEKDSPANADVKLPLKSTVGPEQGETKDSKTEKTSQPAESSVTDASEPAKNIIVKDIAVSQTAEAVSSVEKDSSASVEMEQPTSKTVEPEQVQKRETGTKSSVDQAPATTSPVTQDNSERTETTKMEEMTVQSIERAVSSAQEGSATNLDGKQPSRTQPDIESNKDEKDDVTTAEPFSTSVVKEISESVADTEPSASSVTEEISKSVADVEMKSVEDKSTENVVLSTEKNSFSNVKDETVPPTTAEDVKNDVTTEIADEQAPPSVEENISVPAQTSRAEKISGTNVETEPPQTTVNVERGEKDGTAVEKVNIRRPPPVAKDASEPIQSPSTEDVVIKANEPADSHTDKDSSANVEAGQAPETTAESNKDEAETAKTAEEAPSSITEDRAVTKDSPIKPTELGTSPSSEIDPPKDVEAEQTSQTTVETVKQEIFIEKEVDQAPLSHKEETVETVKKTETGDISVKSTEEVAAPSTRNDSVPIVEIKQLPTTGPENDEVTLDKAVEETPSSITAEIVESVHSIEPKDSAIRATEQTPLPTVVCETGELSEEGQAPKTVVASTKDDITTKQLTKQVETEALEKIEEGQPLKANMEADDSKHDAVTCKTAAAAQASSTVTTTRSISTDNKLEPATATASVQSLLVQNKSEDAPQVSAQEISGNDDDTDHGQTNIEEENDESGCIVKPHALEQPSTAAEVEYKEEKHKPTVDCVTGAGEQQVERSRLSDTDICDKLTVPLARPPATSTLSINAPATDPVPRSTTPSPTMHQATQVELTQENSPLQPTASTPATKSSNLSPSESSPVTPQVQTKPFGRHSSASDAMSSLPRYARPTIASQLRAVTKESPPPQPSSPKPWKFVPTRPRSPRLSALLQRRKSTGQIGDKVTDDNNNENKQMPLTPSTPYTPQVLRRQQSISSARSTPAQEIKIKPFTPTPRPEYLTSASLPSIKHTAKSQAFIERLSNPKAKQVQGPTTQFKPPERTVQKPFNLKSYALHQEYLARAQIQEEQRERELKEKRSFSPNVHNTKMYEGPLFVPKRGLTPPTKPVDLLPHAKERSERTLAFEARQRERCRELEHAKKIEELEREKMEEEQMKKEWIENRFRPRAVPKSHTHPDIIPRGKGKEEKKKVEIELKKYDDIMKKEEEMVEINENDSVSSGESQGSGFMHGLRRSLSPLLGAGSSG